MSTRRAFTLIEFLVILSIIALLIGILLPALGAARRTARCTQESTQTRGIHSAHVLFSQGNNTYYPGFDKDGNRTEDYSTEYRFKLLLDDKYFTGEYLISPSETKTALTQTGIKPTTDNYSYSLLNLSDLESPRIAEWKDSSNNTAVIITDRAIAMDNQGHLKSVHTNPSKNKTEWRGSVAWNDNHVTFESTIKLDTQYGETSFDEDDLFDTTGASMVYGGNDVIIDSTWLNKPADE
jgi:type II secretory pathway pseudopilin PulG